MRLKDIMSGPVEAVRPDTSVSAAEARMREKGVHHLIVASGRDVLGVISTHDIAGASPDAEVGGLMSQDVATGTPRTTVRQAANLLRGRRIGCLPVVERGRVVGIVTISDLLELLGKGEHTRTDPTPYTLRGRGPRKVRPTADRQRLSYT